MYFSGGYIAGSDMLCVQARAVMEHLGQALRVAQEERDQALRERDMALQGREAALQERDAALHESQQAQVMSVSPDNFALIDVIACCRWKQLLLCISWIKLKQD